jgi:alkylation response protein AidB-like acyl-CoA dehydrogenase
MSSVADWEQRAVAWSNEHPPPLGAPAGSRTPSSDRQREEWLVWTRALHASGLAIMQWPAEWGGAGAGIAETRAVARVLREAGAPFPLTDIGIGMVGPAIMAHGTAEQQARHLPGIADGTQLWTQLFSEPGAGSDLAGVRTRAERQDDGSFVVTGQKVWNTYAHLAQNGYLLARTGAVDSRHRGLTMFLVDMASPGITVTPIREITGDADFNEVFLDGLRLPADAVIGTVDGGWAVSMSTLADERTVVGSLALWLETETDRMTGVVQELLAQRSIPVSDGLVTRLGEVVTEVAALVELSGRQLSPGAEPIGKLAYAELNVRVQQLAIDLAVAHPGAVPDPWAHRWSDNYLYTRAYTISGGSNEVMRNVVAKRGLRLGEAR